LKMLNYYESTRNLQWRAFAPKDRQIWSFVCISAIPCFPPVFKCPSDNFFLLKAVSILLFSCQDLSSIWRHTLLV
jgi:hypothetical protein